MNNGLTLAPKVIDQSIVFSFDDTTWTLSDSSILRLLTEVRFFCWWVNSGLKIQRDSTNERTTTPSFITLLISCRSIHVKWNGCLNQKSFFILNILSHANNAHCKTVFTIHNNSPHATSSSLEIEIDETNNLLIFDIPTDHSLPPKLWSYLWPTIITLHIFNRRLE